MAHSLVGKIVKVTWKDHISGLIEDHETINDIKWMDTVPVMEAYGKVLFEDENIIVVHPCPMLSGAARISLIDKPVVLVKKPIISIVELVEKVPEKSSRK